MMTAPDAFATNAEGTYTTTFAIDWVAHAEDGNHAAPLWIGKTLHRDTGGKWTVAPARPGAAWTALSSAAKTVKSALDAAEAPSEPGYYELVGPKLGKRGQTNPHGFDAPALQRHGDVADADTVHFTGVPRNLYGMRNWLAETGLPGLLWVRGGDEFAAVRAELMPA